MGRTPVTESSSSYDSQFVNGWTGRRYLKCDDGQWHLVLRILEGQVADTQCCEYLIVHKYPTLNDGSFPMCPTCVELQFPKDKKKR